MTILTAELELIGTDKASGVITGASKLATKAFAGIAAAALLAGGALSAIVLKSSAATEEINELSRKAGTTTEFMSRMAFAAEQVGVRTEGLRTSMLSLNRRVVAMPKVFKKWGVSTKDINGNLVDTETLLFRVAERMKKATGSAKKLALADELMSEQGRQLVPILAQGAAGLRKFFEEADRAGATISQLSAAIADEFTNEIIRVKSSTAAWGRVLTDIIGPILIVISQDLKKVTGGALAWAQANQDVIRSGIFEFMITLSDTVMPALLTGANLIGKAFFGWKLIFAGLKVVVFGFMKEWQFLVAESALQMFKLAKAVGEDGLAKRLRIFGKEALDSGLAMREGFEAARKEVLLTTAQLGTFEKMLGKLAGDTGEKFRLKIAQWKKELAALLEVLGGRTTKGDEDTGGGGPLSEKKFKKVRKEIDRLNIALNRAAQTMARNMVGAMRGLILGTTTWKEVMLSALDAVLTKLAEIAASFVFRALLGLVFGPGALVAGSFGGALLGSAPLAASSADSGGGFATGKFVSGLGSGGGGGTVVVQYNTLGLPNTAQVDQNATDTIIPTIERNIRKGRGIRGGRAIGRGR